MVKPSSDNIRELVNYRFARSYEVLGDARLLIDVGSLTSAVNRLYYACFYACIGLLLNDGHVCKSHEGAKSQLGLHYVKTGRISIEMGKLYGRLIAERISDDYDDFTEFTIEQIEDLYNDSKEFIDTLQQLI